MRLSPRRTTVLGVAAVVAMSASGAAHSVYLDSDGLGQALIFPYYTVRSVDGNAFNTYLSVTNTATQAKVLRVRVREGRNGAEAIGFNLYLAPYDMWTAALVPDGGQGAKLISADASCTNPPLFSASAPGVREIALNDFQFSGALADGYSGGLDRVREGYIEMIEMATLSGAAAAAVTPGASGAPRDCASVQGTTVPLTGMLGPPGGGLAGGLTLINVNSGYDFTARAEALASLTTQPFYRNFDDAYPDFGAAEVTPSSFVTAGGSTYRLAWASGVEAVTSILMQTEVMNDYLLDASTQSRTDWILTFPTRRFQVRGSSRSLPFVAACEDLQYTQFDRQSLAVAYDPCGGFDLCPTHGPPPQACYASSVVTFLNGAAHVGPVVGSQNAPSSLSLSSTFQNGWADIRFTGAGATTAGLVSLTSSSRVEAGSGAVSSGAFRVLGLPMTGFMLRTFRNGNLTCGSGTCQGNYGSAFAHQPVRSVGAAP
jgi:hypothetical protein